MTFREFFFSMRPIERLAWAERSGTTVGYCTNVANGYKRIELGLADVFVANSLGRLAIADLPLTDRAKFQNSVRTQDL